MSLTNYHCSIQIPPVLRKFRTGSYLIYDDEPPGATNLRRGTALTDMPFRASGSHQLNVTQLETVLQSVAPPGAQLHLVDLREETHLFLNGHAVSWYADKDFANVGQTLAWIVADEAAQLARIKAVPATQIYCLNEDGQGNVTPTGYKELTMKSAATEAEVAGQFPFRPNYIRIPVTDHCMPTTMRSIGLSDCALASSTPAIGCIATVTVGTVVPRRSSHCLTWCIGPNPKGHPDFQPSKNSLLGSVRSFLITWSPKPETGNTISR